MSFSSAQFLHDTAEPDQPDDREPRARYIEDAEDEFLNAHASEIRARALELEDAAHERDAAEAAAGD